MKLSQGMITTGICSQDNKHPEESKPFGTFFSYLKSESALGF